MGAASRTKRKIEKKQKRRAEAARKKAEYQALAGTGKNFKSKQISKARNTARARLKVRDDNCKNIGDLRSNPKQAPAVYDMHCSQFLMGSTYKAKQYTGKYKGLIRQMLVRGVSTDVGIISATRLLLAQKA